MFCNWKNMRVKQRFQDEMVKAITNVFLIKLM